MKILFVIPTLKDGGAEKAMSNLTTHLPENVEADILINSISDHDFPTDANIISLGMPPSKNMGIMYQFFSMVKRILKLYTLKRKKDYDVCISFMDSANIANILSGNKYTKVLCSVRISLNICESMLPEYKYIIIPLIKLLYNKADEIIAVSSGIRKELIEDFGIRADKVVTIENGCDMQMLISQADEPWDEEDNVLKGKKLVVTAGRLSEQKGQWHLIRAFSKVIEEEKDAVLLILGAGPLKSYLEQLTKKLGVQGEVIFKGFVQNPYKYVAKADVFVLPSLYEGYPNAMAEAACLGVPCMATDFRTGSREILAPDLVDNEKEIKEVYLAQYGILTPVCSGTHYHGQEALEPAEVRMADAIMILLGDKGKRKYYAAKSMERSRELGIESVIQKWMQLVSNIK